MSLDVYLEAASPPLAPISGSGIFVRRDGETVELTRAEWDQHFPGQAPVVLTADAGDSEVFWANITHNLGKMAGAAGVYKCMWRPEELGITHAKQLIEPLAAGLERLRANPDEFKIHNPDNGWGDYDGLVRFVANYLEACKSYPEATVRASR